MKAERKSQKKAVTASRKFWKSLTPVERHDTRAYHAAAERLADRLSAGQPRPGDEWPIHSEQDAVNERTIEFLALAGPQQVSASMVEFPGRGTEELLHSWGQIVFDKDNSSVRWESQGGGDNVEQARKSTTSQAFRRALSKVRWTPDTGGVIAYDSEYRGGQGPGVSRAYGPLGAQSAPAYCGPYLEKSGKAMTTDLLTSMEIERT